MTPILAQLPGRTRRWSGRRCGSPVRWSRDVRDAAEAPGGTWRLRADRRPDCRARPTPREALLLTLLVLVLAGHRLPGLHRLLHRPALVPVRRLLDGLLDPAALPRSLLFVVFGLLMAAARGGQRVAGLPAPAGVPRACRRSSRPRALPRRRSSPYRRVVIGRLGVALRPVRRRVGRAAVAHLLLCRQRRPFGSKDPQFGMDVGFYVFELPFWHYLVGFGFAIVLALAWSPRLVVHYLYGGIRLQTPGERLTPAARAHLSVLLGVFVLLKAAAYWLDRYDLVDHRTAHGWITGATYTDINACCRRRTSSSCIALICARAVLRQRRRRRTWLLPALGLGLLVLSAILLGGIWPAIVQHVPGPARASRQGGAVHRAQHRRHAAAYGLDGVEEQDVRTATSTPTDGGATRPTGAPPQRAAARPAVGLSQTFEQLQQVRGYYTSPTRSTSTATRSTASERDAVVAVRELDQSGLPDAAAELGQPAHRLHPRLRLRRGLRQRRTRSTGNADRSSSQDVPPQGAASTITEPRIYFGENSARRTRSSAGRTAASRRSSTTRRRERHADRRTTPTTGKGGVAVGSTVQQAAVRREVRASRNILLSDRVNADSKILYDRSPRERVRRSRRG